MLRACLAILLLALFPAAATAAPARPVEVRLTSGADGLVATFTLPRPTTKFVFAEPSPEIRADTWAMATPGLKLADSEVTAADGKPFGSFQIAIRPDSIERDRIYPALVRMGADGWMIYGPYFKAAEGETRLTARLPKGWVTLSGSGARLDLEGYGFLGSAAYVERGAATVVTPTGTPAWLKAQVLRSANGATSFYSRRLGYGLRRPPLIMMLQRDSLSGGFRGDTTPGDVVSLRFNGKGWLTAEDGAGRRIGRFVAHEFFHFWNKPNGLDIGEAQPWLHEGAAEYAALLYGLQAGDLTEDEFRGELGERLTGCVRALPTAALGLKGPTRGEPVYHCGVVAEWLADLQLRRAGGSRDMLSLWGPILGGDPAGYSVAGFRAAAGPGPLDRLLDGSGPDRWPGLFKALEPFGVALSQAEDPAAARSSAVMQVLAGLCKGKSYGFYRQDDRLVLDASGGCAAAFGGAEVDTLEGQGLFADPLGAYDAVAAACAAGRPVKVGFQGRPVGEWACQAPLPPRPVRWVVEASGLSGG